MRAIEKHFWLPDSAGKKWVFRADFRALHEMRCMYPDADGNPGKILNIFRNLKTFLDTRDAAFEELAFCYSATYRDSISWDEERWSELDIKAGRSMRDSLAYRNFLSELPAPGSPDWKRLQTAILDLALRTFDSPKNEDAAGDPQ